MLIRKKSADTFLYFLLTVPALVLFSFIYIYPIVTGFMYSLTDWNGFTRTYNFVGFRNYATLFDDYRLVNSIWFTTRYVSMLLVAIHVIALGLALFLNGLSKSRISGLTRALFFFPAVLPLITVGLIWGQIFYRVLPLIGRTLDIGFLSSNLLSRPDTAIFGVLFVDVWQRVAIPTVLILAGLQTVPRDLLESATLDGANAFQRFRYVTSVYILPIISMTLVLVLKEGITVFDYIVAMTDGGPGRATESIGLLVYNKAFVEMRFSEAITQSILIFVVVGAVSLVQIRYLSKRSAGE